MIYLLFGVVFSCYQSGVGIIFVTEYKIKDQQ